MNGNDLPKSLLSTAFLCEKGSDASQESKFDCCILPMPPFPLYCTVRRFVGNEPKMKCDIPTRQAFWLLSCSFRFVCHFSFCCVYVIRLIRPIRSSGIKRDRGLAVGRFCVSNKKVREIF
jgi:hypothetical protein